MIDAVSAVGTITAVRVRMYARTAAFRSPLIADVHLSLPCPPPSTLRGVLAAALGGFHELPGPLVVAYAYRHDGEGVDLEKRQRPLATAKRVPKWEASNIMDVPFHAHASLTVWVLTGDPVGLTVRLRRPVWPVRLGRTQDHVDWRPGLTQLTPAGVDGAVQGHAIVPPETDGASGRVIAVPASVSTDRDRTVWAQIRYDHRGSDAVLKGETVYVDTDGVAVVPFVIPAP